MLPANNNGSAGPSQHIVPTAVTAGVDGDQEIASQVGKASQDTPPATDSTYTVEN